jgi:hypothetical protein
MCSAIWVWFLIFDLVSFMIICKLFSFVVFFFFFFFFFFFLCVCVCVVGYYVCVAYCSEL